MDMKRGKELAIRILLLLVGLAIAHLGVTLFLQADLGSDPFNVMVQGVFRTVEQAEILPWVTHGRVHIAICVMIILILLLIDHSYVKIGTVLCMFFGGPIIDFFVMLIGRYFNNSCAMPIRVVGLALGCIILAYGMTIVIKSDAGTGPNDLVAIVIADKTKKRFSVIRIATDIVFVLIGFFLGGTVGVGTIICAFLVGPVAGFFLPVNQRLVDMVLDKTVFRQV